MKISTFVYTLSALAPTLVLGQAPAPGAQQPAPAGQGSAAPDANVVVGNQVLPPGLAAPPVVVDTAAPSAGAANVAPSAGAQAIAAPTPSPNAPTPPANNAAEGISVAEPANSNNQNGQADNVQMPGMQMESSANAQALEPSLNAGMMQPDVPNPSLGSNGLPTPQSSTSSESSSEHSSPTASSSSESSESEANESGSSGSNGEESGLDSDVSGTLDSDSDELASESAEHESSASHKHSSSESDKSSEDKSSHESHFSSDEFASDELSSGAMGMLGQRSPLDAVLCLAGAAAVAFF
ncbi:hypothetical protein GGI23_001081 [Coemansia sp. RSA 2559]|nr:hypothetical protein GGI23_001081 [Coemansia sp. RSA 2559]KAJ2867604.1 hypothetical protein GGI22_001021 [Coemansia erecta]